MISLDLTPRGGGWLERGEWALELGLVHSNTFEISEDFDSRAADFLSGAYESDYTFIADGETTRAHLRIDFGVGSRVQLGLEVPVISHQSVFSCEGAPACTALIAACSWYGPGRPRAIASRNRFSPSSICG